jgi:hypothetical protein
MERTRTVREGDQLMKENIIAKRSLKDGRQRSGQDRKNADASKPKTKRHSTERQQRLTIGMLIAETPPLLVRHTHSHRQVIASKILLALRSYSGADLLIYF